MPEMKTDTASPQSEVTVLKPWYVVLRQPGSRPFGPDDTECVELPVGTRLERWPTTLTISGQPLQDTALVLPGRGTILVEHSLYADLLQLHGVLQEQPASLKR